MDAQTTTEQTRWQEIKKTFNKNKVLKGMDESNPMVQVLAQMQTFTDSVDGIKEAINTVSSNSILVGRK